MSLRIDDSGIGARLQSIREAVGAQSVAYESNRYEIVDVEIPPHEVKGLLSASGLLEWDGRPVFAYIRDHTERTLQEWGGTNRMKKLHFSVCETLENMRKKGRFERYRATNVTSDEYAVDVRAPSGDGVQENVSLHPCRNCLRVLDYDGYRDASSEEKEKIVLEFNTRDAMDKLWENFDVFRQEVSDLQSAHSRTGYTPDWGDVSDEVRRANDWRCNSCGVDLSHARGLLHLHHVDGDKHNNSSENLRCLCKDCHSKQPNHAHMKLTPGELSTIELARREQGIGDEPRT